MKPEPSILSEIVTQAEAAELLGVHESTLVRWVEEGLPGGARLPLYRLGKRRMYWRTDLERLLKRPAGRPRKRE